VQPEFNSCTLCCLSFWIMLYLLTRQTWSFYCKAVRRKILVAFNILCKIFKGSVFVFGRKSHLFNLVKKYLLQELSSEKGACCLCGIMVVLSKCSRRPAFAYERHLLNWAWAANFFGQTGLWVPRHLISIVFEAFPNPKKWLWQIALCFLLIYW